MQDRGGIAQERERELHQAGRLDKIEGRDDLPHPVPYFRKGGQRRGPAAALQLEKRARQRGDHRVMVPPVVTAALELIQAEVVLQLPIMLFDGPAAAREAHQFEERRRGRQIQQIGFALTARP